MNWFSNFFKRDISNVVTDIPNNKTVKIKNLELDQGLMYIIECLLCETSFVVTEAVLTGEEEASKKCLCYNGKVNFRAIEFVE